MVMPAQPEQKYTAVQTILLAAEDLTKAGHMEFSEFELTVASWKRDPNKFGLRGFHDRHPDHKRVMMEIMGQKPNSPVYKKFLEKIRPNTYRLTPLGKDHVRKLRTGVDIATKATTPAPVRTSTAPVKVPSPKSDLYETVAQYATRPEFHRWRANPEEPREWTSAAAFLGLHKGYDVDAVDRLEEIRGSIQNAMDWCKETENDHLTRTASGAATATIHRSELADLLDFLQALVYRFPNHLDRKPGKPKKRFED